jgi:SWI/SNF-related matrix-associated actin-dependent regulator 1 of chromatin subfamily A
VNLYQHQVSGAAWLAKHSKAQLGDEPGMGKTFTTIEALRLKGVTNPLIICPAIARTHWARSIVEAGGFDLPEVVSFERVAIDGMQGMAQRLLGRDRIDSLVVDESQYCKTMTSARAKIILGNDGYARRLEHVIALSGSVPKHPGELFNIVCSLRPDLLIERGLTTREKWMTRFTIRTQRFVRGNYCEKVVGQQNVEELREILSHVLLKRDYASAGLDVPELWFQTLELDGASDAQIDPDSTSGLRVGEWTTLKLGDGVLESIANDPEIARMRRRIGELKAPLVVEMLKHQLRGTDEKVVVFAHHREVLRVLREGLAEFNPVYVDGDTLDVARNIAIDRFQEGSTARVFIGQNIACRFSITLTAAKRAILCEPSWSADDNLQMGRRIARIGSTGERCIAQLVSLAGTLDEAIVKQNAREVKMANEVFQKEGSMT